MPPPPSAVIIARPDELPGRSRVWGTGGWQEPQAREALDWFTLCRISGWSATVVPLGARLPPSERWIIVACDPGLLSASDYTAIERALDDKPLLAIMRSDGFDRERGRTIRVRKVGRGAIATLPFHPSQARDADGAVTARLRRLMIEHAQAPVAWFDHAGTVVLRMDDPGGAQNVWDSRWSYPKLDARQWAAIGAALRRHEARLSVFYVPGWVDDGDPARGALTVGGRAVARRPGAIHPSPLITYTDRAGHAPGRMYDGRAEFASIQKLRKAGLAEVELHGFAHVNPDTAAWARAADRYSSSDWFRELGRNENAALARLPARRHPLTRGIAALKQQFGVTPTTLVAPGDAFTPEAAERAMKLGLRLMSSYYTAIRADGRLAWSQQVCAPYLDTGSKKWLASGLPVIGYFHDKDVVDRGIGWFTESLVQWRRAGARRFIDFRELAAATGRMLSYDGRKVRIAVDDGAPPPPRALPIRTHRPGMKLRD
jgi:peptidoglycan/xylan/chitin deacetylase (PgdA/CDA1 family)